MPEDHPEMGGADPLKQDLLHGRSCVHLLPSSVLTIQGWARGPWSCSQAYLMCPNAKKVPRKRQWGDLAGSEELVVRGTLLCPVMTSRVMFIAKRGFQQERCSNIRLSDCESLRSPDPGVSAPEAGVPGGVPGFLESSFNKSECTYN